MRCTLLTVRICLEKIRIENLCNREVFGSMSAAVVQTPLCAPVHIMVDNWPFHAPVLVMADIFTPVFTNRSLYTPLSTVLRTSFRPPYAPLSTILRTSFDHLTHLYRPSYAPLSTYGKFGTPGWSQQSSYASGSLLLVKIADSWGKKRFHCKLIKWHLI